MPKTHIRAGDAPGIVFTPRPAPGDTADDARLPLVLLGHGAHFGKDDPTMQALCWGLAYGVPSAVLCLDAPHHGERRPPDIDDEAFDALVHKGMGDPDTHLRLADDWRAAADAARAAVPRIDGRTGYAGFSMGSIFGVSIASAIGFDGPIVLAVGGLRGDDAGGAREQNQLMRTGAECLVERDVLMLNMTRDESFPIARAIELFELLPTATKHMVVWQGTHTDLPPAAIEHASAFFAHHFAAPVAAPRA